MRTAGEVEAERAAVVAYLRSESSIHWRRAAEEWRAQNERQRAAIRAMTVSDLAEKIEEGAHRD